MNQAELKIVENLITGVKNEMLGVHCTKDWSPGFRAIIVSCENLILEERKRFTAAQFTLVPDKK